MNEVVCFKAGYEYIWTERGGAERDILSSGLKS